MVSWNLFSQRIGVPQKVAYSLVKVVTDWLQAGFWNKLVLSVCFRTSGVFEVCRTILWERGKHCLGWC